MVNNSKADVNGIIIEKKDGYRIYQHVDGRDYCALIIAFMRGELNGQALPNDCPQRKVYLVEAYGQRFVLKIDDEVDTRPEKMLWQFVFGPFYSRLMQKVNRILDQGCDLIPRMYMVAEKIEYRICRQAVVLLEYVEGTPWADVAEPEQWYDGVSRAIKKLHGLKLASNDVHPGNFIITANGMKIIDISCRGLMWVCRANDIIALRKMYNIKIVPQGLGSKISLYLVKAQQRFHKLSRKLRGKK